MYVAVWSKHHRCLLSNLWKSLGNLQNFSEIFGNLRKVIGNLRKIIKTFFISTRTFKQNVTCPFVDMNFIFECSTRHLTRSLHSLVRYRVEHLKIKFISTRGHVISSICSEMKPHQPLQLNFLQVLQPGQIGIWNVGFHWGRETIHVEPRERPSEQAKNQQTQPTNGIQAE